MVNQFQVLSMEQDHAEHYKFPFQSEVHEQKLKQQKNASLRWLWRNIEKIIYVMVLVYLIILIVNLLSCKDSLILFQFAESSTEHSLSPPKHLAQVGQNNDQSAQNLKQNLLQQILGQKLQSSSLGDQKEVLTENLDNEVQSQKPAISQLSANQPSKLQEQSNFATNFIQTPKIEDAFLIQSPHQQKGEYSNFLQQLKSNEKTRQRDQIYKRIRSIYQDLNDDRHTSIHGLSFKQTFSIIQTFSKGKIPLPLSLITQNSQFSSTLTENDTQYSKYLNKHYLKGEYSEQSICIILSTHNNAYNQQIVRTLNSIYNQNYQDFQVVIMDRISSDLTSSTINSYLNSYPQLLSKTSAMQIDSESQSFAVWTAAQSCKDDSVAVYIEGNTEFLGKQVLKMINYYFQEHKANIIYGDHYTLDVAKENINRFKSSNYDESETFMLAYRNIPKKYGKTISFRANAIRHVPERYIKFNQKHFQYSGIDSLVTSLLEMSCGKIMNIDEPLAFTLVDSNIEKQQQSKRKHEQKLISSKMKIDIC